MEENVIFVKTDYITVNLGGRNFTRDPTISSHGTEAEARSFFKTRLQLGLGVKSCEIIDMKEVKRLLKQNLVKWDLEF